MPSAAIRNHSPSRFLGYLLFVPISLMNRGETPEQMRMTYFSVPASSAFAFPGGETCSGPLIGSSFRLGMTKISLHFPCIALFGTNQEGQYEVQIYLPLAVPSPVTLQDYRLPRNTRYILSICPPYLQPNQHPWTGVNFFQRTLLFFLLLSASDLWSSLLTLWITASCSNGSF